MEAFLADPNESTASQMFASIGIASFLSHLSDPDQGPILLKPLLQLNNFNILDQFGQSSLISLLSLPFLQPILLEHLQGISFPCLDFTLLISKLFEIFAGPNISSSILCKYIFVHKLSSYLSQDNQLPLLNSLINSEDTVVKVRTLELIIELSNISNFEFYDLHGFIDKGIEMVTGDDILLRIVAIEVISELGNSEAGCKKLLGEKIRAVLKMAIEEEAEVHTQNKLILMTCKIFHFTGNESLIDGKFWEILVKLSEKNDPAVVKNVCLSISYLATRPQGLGHIFTNLPLLRGWSKLQKSSNLSIKSFFYHSFAEVLEFCSEEHATVFNRISNFIEGVMKELITPFQDSHIDILKCIKSLVKWKNQALEFLANEKFKEYLFRRPPHQIYQVSYLKFEIVEQLNKHDFQGKIAEKIQRYLKAGVFAPESEMDAELESLT